MFGQTSKKCTEEKSSGCGDGSEAPAAVPERSQRVANLSKIACRISRLSRYLIPMLLSSASTRMLFYGITLGLACVLRMGHVSGVSLSRCLTAAFCKLFGEVKTPEFAKTAAYGTRHPDSEGNNHLDRVCWDPLAFELKHESSPETFVTLCCTQIRREDTDLCYGSISSFTPSSNHKTSSP